jgi:hypothetical protein
LSWRTLRWVPFGAPRPQASRALNGLDPGGDGSFPSGLYLREPFTARDGFAREARVSARITLPHWQSIMIMAESDRFARAVDRWSRREGTWTHPKSEQIYGAGINYPGAEGGDRAMRLTLTSAGSSSIMKINPLVGDGRDVVFRVEYGADSIMTVFANGMRVESRPYTPTPDRRYRLFISGHSVESPVRMRYLRVWRLGER